MRVLNGSQMREADRQTIERHGIPASTLMAHAGAAIAAEVQAIGPDGPIAVVCGRGNNGGDGFVAARLLREAGFDARAFLIGSVEQLTGDARAACAAFRRHAPIIEIAEQAAWQRHRAAVLDASVIVDAIVGTGFTPPLTGLPVTIVEEINAAGRPVIAIDLPSGLSADSSSVAGEAIQAMRTVALGAAKIPHCLGPASNWVGEWRVADIGIPLDVIDAVSGPRLDLLTADVVQRFLRPRPLDAHKGLFGHVLIVGGSIGKTGAAALAAMAALRSGAGLVTVATPASCVPVVAALGAEYMTLPLPDDGAGRMASSALDVILDFGADVIAVGPGLGRSAGVDAVVRGLVEQSRAPLVVDADGLNALASSEIIGSRAAADLVLTPHPGEMGRLLKSSAAAVQADRLAAVQRLARDWNAHVVLKGQRTLIGAPDGRVAINQTGNPGMATGGTGDVLTGAIAAWIAQLRDPMSASMVATYLHGRAGDLAASHQGEVAMIAGDLLAHLGPATLELTPPRRRR
jgi:NAD(P)H-hydrate epimerase